MDIETKHSQRNRAAILEAAANIIREGGLHALKMSNLADKAKLTRWTIYNHFGNLDGVKRALYDRHDYFVTNLPKIVALATQKNGAIQFDLLAHIITQHFDALMRDPLSREFAIAEFLRTDSVIAQMVASREQRMLKMLKASGSYGLSQVSFPMEFLFPIILGGVTYMAFQYRIGGQTSCFGVGCLRKEFKANLQQFLTQLIKVAVANGNDTRRMDDLAG